MIAAISLTIVVIMVLVVGFVGEDLPGRYRAAQEEWEGGEVPHPSRERA